MSVQAIQNQNITPLEKMEFSLSDPLFSLVEKVTSEGEEFYDSTLAQKINLAPEFLSNAYPLGVVHDGQVDQEFLFDLLGRFVGGIDICNHENQILIRRPSSQGWRFALVRHSDISADYYENFYRRLDPDNIPCKNSREGRFKEILPLLASILRDEPLSPEKISKRITSPVFTRNSMGTGFCSWALRTGFFGPHGITPGSINRALESVAGVPVGGFVLGWYGEEDDKEWTIKELC